MNDHFVRVLLLVIDCIWTWEFSSSSFSSPSCHNRSTQVNHYGTMYSTNHHRKTSCITLMWQSLTGTIIDIELLQPIRSKARSSQGDAWQLYMTLWNLSGLRDCQDSKTVWYRKGHGLAPSVRHSALPILCLIWSAHGIISLLTVASLASVTVSLTVLSFICCSIHLCVLYRVSKECQDTQGP